MSKPYKFSEKSKSKLITCHKDIQTMLNELIKIYDFSVLEGLRSTERQISLYKQGKSKLDGITRLSKHQSSNGISLACDIMPYKQGTNAFSGKEKDNRRFYTMMGMLKAIHARLLEENKINCGIRFGLDWNSNDKYDDQNFDDLPHFEITPYENVSEDLNIEENKRKLYGEDSVFL